MYNLFQCKNDVNCRHLNANWSHWFHKNLNFIYICVYMYFFFSLRIYIYTHLAKKKQRRKLVFAENSRKYDETKRYVAAWCSLDRGWIRIFTRTWTICACVKLWIYIYVRMRTSTSKIPRPRIWKNNFRDCDKFFFSFF